MASLEIKDHVARARANPSTENLEALWRAVFMLKAWYFVPANATEGPSHPTVTLIDGQPWLLAFTNVRRIRDFARAQNLVDAKGEVLLLILDPKESMQRIQEVADHIAGVVFNIGSEETFRAPVKAVEEYALRFGLDLPSRADS